VAWAGDERRALAALKDGTVRLLDVETGEELDVFADHTAAVRAIVCSVDGRYSISGGYDRAVRQWRLPEPRREKAPPESLPFVLLRHDGSPEEKFSTLSGAAAEAGDGDTIEILGDGPFVCPPIVLTREITLRAAAGFSPILQLESEAVESDRPQLETTAPLTLEGLVFHRIGGGQPDAYHPAHILSHRADLRIANCRFLVEGNTNLMWAVRASRSTLVDVRNSQCLGPWAGIQWEMSSGGRLLLENSLFCGKSSCLAIVYPGGELDDAQVALTGNTFIGNGLFSAVVDTEPGGVAPKERAVQVESRRNVCDVWSGYVLLSRMYGLADQDALNAFDDAAVLRRWLSWRDQSNLYRSDEFLRSVAFVGYSSPRTTILCASHAEWEDFWSFPSSGSVQGEMRYQGGNLRAMSARDLEALGADGFRLVPQSPGAAAGPAGEDLGADVDLVGPGPAFDRWKRTPAYQQWLSD
jgi:hypothetical protein